MSHRKETEKHRGPCASARAPCDRELLKEGKGLAAVIFCCSDEFLKELVRLMPDKYLEF